MDTIGKQLETYRQINENKLRINNENQFHVQSILDILNPERKSSGFKPMSWTQLNGMLHNKKTRKSISRLAHIAETKGGKAFWIEYNRLLGKYDKK